MKKLLIALALASSFGTNALEQMCEPDMQRTSPTAGFIDNNNGTVTDRATKLKWMRCSIGQTFNAETSNCEGMPDVMYWQDALKTAKNVRTSEAHKYYHFAGVSNWRLPNVKELNSIRELACVNPILNSKIFPNIMAIVADEGGYAFLWTSTPLAGEEGIMIMDINSGSLYSTLSPTDYQRQILLVADPE